jgi:hypothetical protein
LAVGIPMRDSLQFPTRGELKRPQPLRPAGQRGKFPDIKLHGRGFMVNFTVAFIFKGILEIHKSTRNREKFAQMRAKNTSRSCVYHVCINHDWA